MSIILYPLLLLLCFATLISCEISGLNANQVNSVLSDTGASQKTSIPKASDTVASIPKVNQEKVTNNKLADAVPTPVVELPTDAKASEEDVDDQDEDAEDTIQEGDTQNGDGDEENDQQEDDDDEEADQQADDQQDDQQQEEEQDTNSKVEVKVDSKEAKEGPKPNSKEAKKDAKPDSKEAGSIPKADQSDVTKVMEQAETMVDIIHLLGGDKAFTASPNGQITLNVEWLQKEGGEAGQKLINLVEDDKKSMAPEVGPKSDAIFLKEGITSFKFGLKDDIEELNKKWEEGGKKDGKLEQTVLKIKNALSQTDEIIKVLDFAISEEQKNKPVVSAHGNKTEAENLVPVTAPAA